MLAEIDISSKRTFFTQKSWRLYFVDREYTERTKDPLENEYRKKDRKNL